MLAAIAALPDGPTARPPIVLVHGAANSAGVWTCWQRELARSGWSSFALDLRGHGRSDVIDLARAGMADYASDVAALLTTLGRPAVVMGWSMGGLAAMVAAASASPIAYVGLAPSPPARRRDPTVPIREGTFGPEEYGIVGHDPADQPTMPDLDLGERALALASLGPESRRARDDRKAGVVITRLPCPALIVAGSADETFPPSTYDALPFPADRLAIDGASHWGLVLSRRSLVALIPAVLTWLEQILSQR